MRDVQILSDFQDIPDSVYQHVDWEPSSAYLPSVRFLNDLIFFYK